MADQTTDIKNETFEFELVSPEARLMKQRVRMVVIPGEEGYFGVLPNHCPLLATIKPGVVEVFPPGGAAPERIFIAGGFADVTPVSCSILAEETFPVAQLDRAELEKTAQNLEEDMRQATQDLDKARIQRRLSLVQAKLDAAISAGAAA